jgi:hypothetical protein
MIFARKSHTLMFVIGIMALAAVAADERGTVAAIAEGADRGEAGSEELQTAMAPAEQQHVVIEDEPTWEEEADIVPPPPMQDMEPEPYDPGEEMLDPQDEALMPEPVTDDW